MAGIASKQFEMFDQLRKDGWTIYDMAEFEPKIFDIVAWCRDTFGSMLVMYEADIINCRWHGGMVEMMEKPYTLFAFKDPADYTMLKLKWAS